MSPDFFLGRHSLTPDFLDYFGHSYLSSLSPTPGLENGLGLEGSLSPLKSPAVALETMSRAFNSHGQPVSHPEFPLYIPSLLLSPAPSPEDGLGGEGPSSPVESPTLALDMMSRAFRPITSSNLQPASSLGLPELSPQFFMKEDASDTENATSNTESAASSTDRLRRKRMHTESPLPGEPATKQRMRWTQQMHEDFESAYNRIKENQIEPSPKLIQEELNNPSLTLAHVKAHLQKYRLKCKRQQPKRPAFLKKLPHLENRVSQQVAFLPNTSAVSSTQHLENRQVRPEIPLSEKQVLKRRMYWTQQMHEDFVSIYNQIKEKQNEPTPKRILVKLKTNYANYGNLQLAHVKSHLQKYRELLRFELERSTSLADLSPSSVDQSLPPVSTSAASAFKAPVPGENSSEITCKQPPRFWTKEERAAFVSAYKQLEKAGDHPTATTLQYAMGAVGKTLTQRQIASRLNLYRRQLPKEILSDKDLQPALYSLDGGWHFDPENFDQMMESMNK